MEELLNKAKDFFIQSPEWIYLIIGVIFLILSIGIIKNKDWAISPNSGQQRFFYNTFGRTAFRVVVGVIFLLATIAGFGGFILYHFY